ncbi:MAG: hypothetical protein Q8922_10355 [Bacteroidota bacterium]|nr:hypothetical protein [Bacteroidota bacterium]MDP4234597.1 hypothetical protein [Bacteroidota bacterium]MDP4243726.1 hypothetical protein [Bacteroidota bacterium]MDP4288326.1 hypothetical protein [Bacteroidota bacterium]
MKLLLDERVPEDLKDFMVGHDVATTGEMGWKGIKNGDLMNRAVTAGLDVFLTSDKNLRHQQNIGKYQVAVIVFDVLRNTLPELRQKLPKLYELLRTVEKAKLYLC